MSFIANILDPITLKRLRRFRQKKRAWMSMWVLIVLYILSLAAELICNDRPLYIRFNGKSYFPVFKYYPQSTFMEDGGATRVNYRNLKDSEEFKAQAGNFMIFQPVPFNPLENIDAESLRSEETVTITFKPLAKAGTVNIDKNYNIVRSQSCGFFLNTEDENVNGLDLRNLWDVSELAEQIERRFRNEAAERKEILITPAFNKELLSRVSVSTFSPRSKAPDTVRLIFRQKLPKNRSGIESYKLSRDNLEESPKPSIWKALDDPTRENIMALAVKSFDEYIAPFSIELEDVRYGIEIKKKGIIWPYPPVRGHWLGIDSTGRDVFARILYGLRISMTFGFLLVIVSVVIGIVVGALQGYYGGKVDMTTQRFIEIWSALPFLYVMILMGSIYGRSFALLLVCYALFRWIGMSYYIRAEFLRLRKHAFVDAAKCAGIPARKIIFRHILPNAITPVITFFPFYLVGAIGSLAILDFLGFGLPPPTPSWGEMLHQAQQYRWAWWLILYPSLALFMVIILGVFIGEGVRDAFDPRPQSKME